MRDKNQNKMQLCECNLVHNDIVAAVKQKMPDEKLMFDASSLFKVFGDYTRTRIISALFLSELCVCDIAYILNMTKSAVSHQLRILRQTKIVKMRKDGREVFYSLDDTHIYEIYKMAVAHLQEKTEAK